MGKTKNYFNKYWMWLIEIALIIGMFFYFVPSSLAMFENLNPKDYFQISYTPATFSKTKISGSTVFYITIRGKASATKNLPIAIKEARITSKVIAQNKITNEQQILNSNYTISIKPFPTRKGQSYEIKKQIPLQFPKASKSGEYIVVGKLLKAEVKLPLLGWKNVTNYFPQSREIGSVTYTTSKIQKSK